MNNKPKILFIDVETSPIKGWSWEAWDSRVLKVLEPSKIISVAWKFLGDNKTQCLCLSDYRVYKKGHIDDKDLVTDIWRILDEADVIVAHNGLAFDLKKINARFIYFSMPLPSPSEVIDTLKIAKKHFKFDMNSLDALGEYLGEGRKLSTGGFELWDNCINGKPEAWAKLKEYNIQDVELLERIYLRLRPYFEHPNLNLLSDKPQAEIACPSCLSTDIVKRGFSVTRTGRKQRFQCSSCGSWSTSGLETVKGILR